MTKFFAPALLLGALAALPARAADAVAPITAAQAVDGRSIFMDYCSGCHGSSLMGGQGPSLVDSGFRADWSDKSIKDLLHFIMTNMPLNKVGTLSDENYLDAAAFILAVNGAKPGQTPLTKDSDVRIGSIADGNMVLAALNGEGVFAYEPVKPAPGVKQKPAAKKPRR